eukprot:g54717.t1
MFLEHCIITLILFNAGKVFHPKIIEHLRGKDPSLRGPAILGFVVKIVPKDNPDACDPPPFLVRTATLLHKISPSTSRIWMPTI